MTVLDIEHLPPVARELIEVIGLDATRALIEAFGGTRLYVPGRLAPDHALVKLLGEPAAAALAAHYAGDELGVPRAAAAMRAALHRQIVAAYDAGASAARLAREHGCTERWIYAIVARRRSELASRQASLF